MKRLIILLVLMLSMAVWAQNTNRNRNVLGAPVYYDTLGNVIGKTQHGDTVAHLPKHHYFNRLSNEYNTYFFELEGMVGSDLAIGFNFTYLPERWGLYGSMLAGINRCYVSLGPTLRMSDNGNLLDWQLYGGIMFSSRLGAELGIRMAAPLHGDSRFCWESLSLGVGMVGRHPFVTCGLSLELSACASFYSLFW